MIHSTGTIRTSADAQARSWDRDAAMAELEEASQSLRRLVWDPIEAHLGDCETVFLVPEGAFHLIDFAALSRDDGRFLIEDGPLVQILAIARDLCHYASVDSGTRPENRSILALGNVDYTRASSEPLSVCATARSFRTRPAVPRSGEQLPWPRRDGLADAPGVRR